MTRYEEVRAALRERPRTWQITGVAGSVGSNLLEARNRKQRLSVRSASASASASRLSSFAPAGEKRSRK
ncbi:hypothetical protein AMST5_03871 [freshwater sediment metagenome]|uniref:Uncharacterized protein n=1 Tax=freshwater sediment metagenome TaxID=556182 RepID=A0AA48M5D8_9ZZZZ